MPWGRLDDQANSNGKLLALSDAAWRMWGCGLIYCQANLTDGFIPEHAVLTFGVRARNKRVVIDELCQAQVPGKGPCWHPVPGGYQIHDYLDWNDSREAVLRERAIGKQRLALFQNPELRQLIKARDGDTCRYCGREVRWNDRKGDLGGTYDHVIPDGGNDAENLVVACRGCNSRKRGRTPEEAGMPLLPSNRESRFRSRLNQGSQQATTSTPTKGLHTDREDPSRGLGERFDRFWAAYPRKVSKPDAARKFAKLNPDDELLTVLLLAVGRQARSAQWQRDQGQYIPHPATWLSQRRWEDELEVTPAPAKIRADWRLECAELHASRCSNVHFHQALLTAAKETA